MISSLISAPQKAAAFVLLAFASLSAQAKVIIPPSETQITYENSRMGRCLSGKDASGNPNPPNFCKHSLTQASNIPARGGFAGTDLLEVALFSPAGDRLDGFFDCKMARVPAKTPTADNSPNACVRVRCGYMGGCPAGAPTCAQHETGAVACQMYGLRDDNIIANVGSIAGAPLSINQVTAGCVVTPQSFDCTQTPGYDPAKTYFIQGLDPVSCKPICATVAASPSSVPSSAPSTCTTCPAGTNLQGGLCLSPPTSKTVSYCDYRCQGAGGCVSQPCFLTNQVCTNGSSFNSSFGGKCDVTKGPTPVTTLSCPSGSSLDAALGVCVAKPTDAAGKPCP